MRRGMLYAGAIGLAAVVAAPATAAVKSARSGTALKVARPFVGPKVLGGARFTVIPPDSHPAAWSSTRMAGFPTAGKTFAILSNGNALFAPRRNISESTSFATNGLFIRGTRDVVILRVNVRVPRNRSCLQFDFKFLSEEFPEFVDSEFNDGFIAEIGRAKGQSNWYSSSNEDPRIQHDPNNFAVDGEGRPVHVNNFGGTNRVAPRFARGTTYDGATRILRASTPVSAGRHYLWLSIFDQGDRGYDSSVFIDRLRLRRNACSRGVSPAP